MTPLEEAALELRNANEELRAYRSIDESALIRKADAAKQLVLKLAAEGPSVLEEITKPEPKMDMPAHQKAKPTETPGLPKASEQPDSIDTPSKEETEAVLNNDTPFTGIGKGTVYTATGVSKL